MNTPTPEQPPDMARYQQVNLMPLEVLQHGFRAALSEAGYHSREDILALVQEVKREVAAEYSATTGSDE